MKKLIISIVSFLYSVYFLTKNNIITKSSRFYYLRLKCQEGNIFCVEHSELSKAEVFVNGKNNCIKIKGAEVSNSFISISGDNNELILDVSSKLRASKIHLRGSNCKIKIGKGTTFGGIRIVNVGRNNDILIGEDCLFADNIELWASDTHSILNEQGEKINCEEPIIIEDRVWIGSHAKILKGVTIGHDSVVGMGSIVTKDIYPNTLNIGTPNKVIKEGISWKNDYL